MKHLFNLFKILLVVGLTLSTTASGPAFAQGSAGERQTRLTGTVGQANEERLVRVEEGVKSALGGLEKRMDALEASLNKRIDDLRADMNSRFDDIKNFMYWGFGIIFGWVGILMGFILWDRRTTLAPVVREQRYIQDEIDEWKKLTTQLVEKEKTIIEVLKKYAENDPKLKEILDKAALF